ncbi:Na+/H+ antiporter [Nitrospira moscoviensis]|uniref:Putative Na+/H+ antiporter n=1 Tax=Nitrospira moscoviensis TaxID=42253 RepID=A0A0K2GBY3_NITMO|nr:Na+/H+ antiporter [Nitrospira moscoviensis]ALA58455.1 putative Na+/H+ antiporter [Nitrospira moscoviensis]
MENLHQLEIIILLLAAVFALTTMSQRLGVAYPILLVVGGLALGLVPGLPTVMLHPDLVFLVFLPPILWAAAYFTSLREFRQNLRPISLLAVGLVLATTAGVAAVAHAVLPGMGWAEAIALGAIVSPPDAVSATAIGRRLGIPRRVVTILEGESLVNDATALVLYRAAVGAAVTGAFSWSGALLEFVFAALVGVAIGLGVALITRWTLCATEDSFTQIGITLLAPYIAWVAGELVHASAVLACVAGGLHLRRHFSSAVSPATRIQARAVWDVVVFLLNGVIFILIGLQLGSLRQQIPAGQFQPLLAAGALISATAIGVRLLWVPLAAVLPRWLSASVRRRDPLPPWSHIFLTSWTGMRGIVTLAGAMALPVMTAAGAPFPFRAEIVLISFGVILITLVGQGLSLPPLIRLLPHLEDDRAPEEEERLAREQAATAALSRLDALAGEDWLRADQADRLRAYYGRRVERFAGNGTVDEDCSTEAGLAFRRLRHETLSAERRAVIALRNDGRISDEVLHRLEHELDVEALRAGIGERRSERPAPSG